MNSIWQAANTLRNTICSFAAEHKVPGVRLNATKFLEQIVLVFTADVVPSLALGARSMRQQPMQGLHGILIPATVSCSRQHHICNTPLLSIKQDFEGFVMTCSSL